MKLLACMFLTAGVCFAQIPVKWEVETTKALAKEVEAYQGETILFTPSFLEYGTAVSTNGLACSFVWQTNGMASTWWTTNGTAFRPSMDVGASRYSFFIRAEGTGGVNYRANGVLKMKASPGFTPNTLPPPELSAGLAGMITTQAVHTVALAGLTVAVSNVQELAAASVTEDRVNDLLAENENGYMIGYPQAYGIYGSYLVQKDFLFTLPFYYDSDSVMKYQKLGLSSQSIFFYNSDAKFTHIKMDGVAYNGAQSILWPLTESVSSGTPRTFATREWSAEQAAAHVAAPNPHTNSVAWYLRDSGTNGLLVITSSNGVFSVSQVKE